MPPDDETDDGIDPPRRGRRPKLTEDMLEAAVRIALAGNFRHTLAKTLGVNPGTFRRWMALGRKYPDGLYGRLVRVIPLAEGEAEARAVLAVTEAGREDVKHLKWWLERKFPERWGPHRGEFVEIRRQIKELARLMKQDEADRPAG